MAEDNICHLLKRKLLILRRFRWRAIRRNPQLFQAFADCIAAALEGFGQLLDVCSGQHHLLQLRVLFRRPGLPLVLMNRLCIERNDAVQIVQDQLLCSAIVGDNGVGAVLPFTVLYRQTERKAGFGGQQLLFPIRFFMYIQSLSV